MTAPKGHNSKVGVFAERVACLTDAYREDLKTIADEVKNDGLDPTGVKRLASWKRKDPVKREEAEAIDHQYRFLAGEVPTPATLPAEGELATAVRLYREEMTVTQVEKEMGVSRGKAHKLKTLAALFMDVRVHVNVNAQPSARPMEDGDLGEWTEDRGERAVPLGASGCVINCTLTNGTPAASVWQAITAPVLEELAREEAARVEREAAAARKRAERLAFVAHHKAIDEDPLTIPPHLKRARDSVPA